MEHNFHLSSTEKKKKRDWVLCAMQLRKKKNVFEDDQARLTTSYRESLADQLLHTPDLLLFFSFFSYIVFLIPLSPPLH